MPPGSDTDFLNSYKAAFTVENDVKRSWLTRRFKIFAELNISFSMQGESSASLGYLNTEPGFGSCLELGLEPMTPAQDLCSGILLNSSPIYECKCKKDFVGGRQQGREVNMTTRQVATTTKAPSH